MTAENSNPDEVGADELAVMNGDELGDLDEKDREALAEASQRLAETVSRGLSTTQFDPAMGLNQMVQRAAMPRALESTRSLKSIMGASVRPQILKSPDRLSQLLSEAAMPRATDVQKLSGALAGVDSTRTMKRLPLSSALASQASMLGKSALAEALGRSTAERAAFSVTSGLTVSDSVTSMVSKLMADTGGSGLSARSDLVASLGLKASGGLADSVARLGLTAKGSSLPALGLTSKRPSVEALGLTATSGLGEAVTRALGSGMAPLFGGIPAAVGASESVRRITEGLFASDIGWTRSLAMQQLVATSGIADLIGGDKMMASWRQSLLSEATARSLVGTMALPGSSANLLRDIVGTNAATARVVSRYAELNKSRMLAPAISTSPTRELRAFLARMPVAPDVDELTFAVRASRGVAGIAAADLLAADGVVELEAGELLEAEVVDPWVSGPQKSRAVLLARLGALEGSIPELLQAAWDQVERKGPAAVSMAAHAVVEAVDRTLRAVAPDEAVLTAQAAGDLNKEAVYDKGGRLVPTRTGRIAFALLQRRPGEARLVAAQTKALAKTVSVAQEELQAGKHASEGTVGLIRTYLVSVEYVLTQLLYEPGDD